jgi:hypothetical protein
LKIKPPDFPLTDQRKTNINKQEVDRVKEESNQESIIF